MQEHGAKIVKIYDTHKEPSELFLKKCEKKLLKRIVP